MDVISMHQAKSSLSKLVSRAKQGEVVYIGAYGRADVKLVAVDPKEKRNKKKIGVLAGKLIVPEDFDEPLPDDVLGEFENE